MGQEGKEHALPGRPGNRASPATSRGAWELKLSDTKRAVPFACGVCSTKTMSEQDERTIYSCRGFLRRKWRLLLLVVLGLVPGPAIFDKYKNGYNQGIL